MCFSSPLTIYCEYSSSSLKLCFIIDLWPEEDLAKQMRSDAVTLHIKCSSAKLSAGLMDFWVRLDDLAAVPLGL